MLDRLANRQPVHTHIFSGYWLDIGRPDDYEYANDHFDELSTRLGLDLK
jgi:NDP-sugar pyrophosphorylase family protein